MALPADNTLAFFLPTTEATGTRADISGNGRDADPVSNDVNTGAEISPLGFVKDTELSPIGTCATFSLGYSTTLRIAHDSGIDIRNDSLWSISFWVHVQEDDLTNNYFAKDVVAMYVRLYTVDGVKRIAIVTPDGSVQDVCRVGLNHVVGGRDPATGELWIRVNGRAKVYSATTPGLAYDQGNSAFLIGRGPFALTTCILGKIRFAMYRFSDAECLSLFEEFGAYISFTDAVVSTFGDSKFATGIGTLIANHIRHWNLTGPRREVVVYNHGYPGTLDTHWIPASPFSNVDIETLMDELMDTPVAEGGAHVVVLSLGTNGSNMQEDGSNPNMTAVCDYILSRGAKLILGFSPWSRDVTIATLQARVNVWMTGYAAAHSEDVGLEVRAYDYFESTNEMDDDIHPSSTGTRSWSYLLAKAAVDFLYGDGAPTIGGNGGRRVVGSGISLG